MSEKFESQFEKIVGGSEEEKQKGLEKYDQFLNDPTGDIEKEFKSNEIQKAEKDLESIKETENAVDAIVKKWGGNPKPIPPEKVHILKEDSVPLLSENKFERGFHQPAAQAVFVEQSKSEIGFRQTLAHELFHQKSYKSAQVYDRRKKLGDYIHERRGTKIYRAGFQMVDRKNPQAQPGEEDVYFSRLEEAIVAASTHKFLKDYLSRDPRYADAFERAEKVKLWMEKIPEMFPSLHRKLSTLKYIYALEGESAQELVDVLDSSRDNDYKLGFLDGRLEKLYKNDAIIHADRIPEIEELDSLMGELIAKSNGKFKTNDEVFDMFARANYTGNILSVGKTIDSTLGKGAFRRIAENSKKAGKARSVTQRVRDLF